MENMISKIDETALYLRNNGFDQPDIGIVLGTGLNQLSQKIQNSIALAYQSIPNFPEATVEFHEGQLIYGNMRRKKVIAMQGRFHHYEGYSMQQITFPIRVMRALGIKILLLSNAAGGIKKEFKKGDLVVIEDHINLLPENPLRGLNEPQWGNRFVDLSAPYDVAIIKKLEETADRLSISIKKGVYAAVAGPNLETRAEYRYLRSIGADLVGMSTVPEVIVANHMGLSCAAISVVTDECDPDNLRPADITEIIQVAAAADNVLSELVENVLDII
jgi:purine-nucleoside phosphorylase